MTDIQGREIKVGDKIAYVRKNGQYSSQLALGAVVKLCAKSAAVKNHKSGKWDPELYYVAPLKLVVLD